MSRTEEAARILERADRVDREVHVARGALQARQQELDQIRRECEAQGIDPSNVDVALQRLEEQLATEMRDLQQQVEQAERALQGGSLGNP